MRNLRFAAAFCLLTLSGCIAVPALLTSAEVGLGGHMAGKRLTKAQKADAQANMTRASATAIGGGLAPDGVRVSDVKVSDNDASWTAETQLGRYSCSSGIPVRMGTAYCVRR